MDGKWFFIAIAVMFGAMFAGMAVSERAEALAKRDIIVACYQAGNKDCDKLWEKKNPN